MRLLSQEYLLLLELQPLHDVRTYKMTVAHNFLFIVINYFALLGVFKQFFGIKRQSEWGLLRSEQIERRSRKKDFKQYFKYERTI